jgi:lysophospholipase L1-like esterase
MDKIKGLILFGDSVVAGRGVKDRKLSFGRILQAKLPFPVLIKGKSFITTEDAMGRLEKEVLSKDKRYSHVLVFLGNNDGRLIGFNTPKFSVQEFKLHMSEIIRKIQESSREVLLTNLQLLGNEDIHRIHPTMPKFLKPPATPLEWHKQYSDACKDIALDCKISFIDIRSRMEEEKNKGNLVIAGYCLDPNELGHRLIAETIISFLENRELIK